LALIAFVVWRVWRSITAQLPGPRRPAERPPGAAGSSTDKSQRQIEDMVRCATCGTYVTASARSCGRTDCPRRWPLRGCEV